MLCYGNWPRCAPAVERGHMGIEKMIMASSPIISGQIDGKIMETVTDYIFLGSKITVDGARN